MEIVQQWQNNLKKKKTLKMDPKTLVSLSLKWSFEIIRKAFTLLSCSLCGRSWCQITEEKNRGECVAGKRK